MTSDIEACGQQIEGIFGDQGDEDILKELRRAAVGTRPACAVIDSDRKGCRSGGDILSAEYLTDMKFFVTIPPVLLYIIRDVSTKVPGM